MTYPNQQPRPGPPAGGFRPGPPPGGFRPSPPPQPGHQQPGHQQPGHQQPGHQPTPDYRLDANGIELRISL